MAEFYQKVGHKSYAFGQKLPQCVKDVELVGPYGWVVECGGSYNFFKEEEWALRHRDYLKTDFPHVQLFPVYELVNDKEY